MNVLGLGRIVRYRKMDGIKRNCMAAAVGSIHIYIYIYICAVVGNAVGGGNDVTQGLIPSSREQRKSLARSIAR